jgi:hypothetical protein
MKLSEQAARRITPIGVEALVDDHPPLRITSVITATTETAIWLKSIIVIRMEDLIGKVISRMSTILMASRCPSWGRSHYIDAVRQFRFAFGTPNDLETDEDRPGATIGARAACFQESIQTCA